MTTLKPEPMEEPTKGPLENNLYGLENNPEALQESMVVYTFERGERQIKSLFTNIWDAVRRAMYHLEYLEAEPVKIQVGGFEWLGPNIRDFWQANYMEEAWGDAIKWVKDQPWYHAAVTRGLVDPDDVEESWS